MTTSAGAPWGTVHVGDRVRGADQRVWTVVARERLAPWVVRGEQARMTLRREADAREVTVAPRLADPAEVVERTSTTAEAAAVDALIGQGMTVELLEETVTTTDQFAAPAAAPDAGIKRDRWGRYVLPHPETGVEQGWTRATTLARTLADMYGIQQWELRAVAKGMAMRPDLVTAAAAADPDEDKSTLRDLAKQAKEAAGTRKGANLGTAFHQAAQRLDRGEALQSMSLPDVLVADLSAYRDALRDRGLSVTHMERVVVCPALGCAGTLDRIVAQPAGVTKSESASVLDLKSAKDLSYSWLEVAIQQAIYANATHMWDATRGCWEAMPAVDTHRALIAHAPVGKAETTVYGVDLVKGWRCARAALSVRDMRKDSYSWLVDPAPVAMALHRARHAASREELAKLWETCHPQGLWTEEVDAAARARLSEIS